MNEYIIHEDYAEMILYDKQGNEKARALINIEDVERCKEYRWSFDSTNKGYVICRNSNIRLHRFLTDCPSDMIVDHINGNGLDNRKNNLRICTKLENNRNRKSNGVSQLKNGKWRAYITVNRKQINLGRYKTKARAIQVRKKAEIKYFGDYRRQE